MHNLKRILSLPLLLVLNIASAANAQTTTDLQWLKGLWHATDGTSILLTPFQAVDKNSDQVSLLNPQANYAVIVAGRIVRVRANQSARLELNDAEGVAWKGVLSRLRSGELRLVLANGRTTREFFFVDLCGRQSGRGSPDCN